MVRLPYGLVTAALLLGAAAAGAQTPATPPPATDRPPVTLEIRSFIYADNTEFLDNAYRDGETLIGQQVRAELVFPVGPTARFLGGFHVENVAGGDTTFKKARPVVALEMPSPFGHFTLGTLRSGQMGRDPGTGLWPEVSGPHGLLPALQVDTLTLERPYEAGAQLRRTGPLAYDGWLAWQKLNTASQRERLDAGVNARVRLLRTRGVEAQGLVQSHVVHEGGQLFDVGAVGDSVASAFGLGVSVPAGPGVARVEAYALRSKHDPDRNNRVEEKHGTGRVITLTYDVHDWHGLFLAAHTDTFAKWEGDPNYAAPTLLGGFNPLRDYKEMSISRRVVLGPAADLLTNLRFYRVDGDWDYAYRIAAAIKFAQPLRRRQP